MPLKRRDLLAHRDVTTFAAIGLFVGSGVLFRRFTVDDAFISYRYARNLASGAGLVMNPGERVEGISNLPWTALLGLAAAAGLEPHTAAPVFSFLCGLAGIVLTAELGARVVGDERAGGIAALWLACCAPWSIWSMSGMESSAYALVLLVVLIAVTRPPALSLPTGLGLGALAALRPEGIQFSAPVLGSYFDAWPGWRRRLAGAVAGFVAVVLPLLVFRWVYYGDWVPNPVHVKAGLSGAALGAGLLYTAKLALVVAPGVLLSIAAMLSARSRPLAALAACVAVQLAFAVAVGGDHFDGYRFAVPILPGLAVGAEVGIRALRGRPMSGRGFGVAAVFLCAVGGVLLSAPELLADRAAPLLTLGRIHRDADAHAVRLASEARFVGAMALGLGVLFVWIAVRARALADVQRVSKATSVHSRHAVVVHESARARSALAVLVVLALALTALPTALDPGLRSCREPDAAARYGRVVGEWLRTNVAPETLVATNAAGSLAYFAELPVVDMLGLTDRHIARRPPDRRQWVGHEKGDGAYVLRRAPGIVIFGGPEGSVEPWPFQGDQELAANPEFRSLYALRRASLTGFEFVYYERVTP